MSATKTESLAIVGVGLIGGSIALAARRSGQFAPIIGVGRDAQTLKKWQQAGIIDEGTTDLAASAKRADIMVFCTPVDQIPWQILLAGKNCKPGTLLTDAGSTKDFIVGVVGQQLPNDVHFVGAHPLAGSEKRGAEHARADLFDNRLTVITPGDNTEPEAVERATQFWESLGCRTTQLSSKRHDEILAMTSHLPHLVAAALSGILPADFHPFIASGFRDTTRIAAGDPGLWSAILDQNARQILEALGELEQRLNQFKQALAAGDNEMLVRQLTEAKKVRDDLGS